MCDREAMDLFQGMAIPSQPLREVNYTPGIDIGEPYVPTEEQLNTFCPENVNPMVAPQPSGTKAKRTGRLKNFSIKEDEILCSGWLNMSKDPIVGVNQSNGSYWDRITAYCNENNCTRTKSALQHRWADIQKDTFKFCGCYAQIERLNQSGKSDGDKLKDAMQLFDGLHKTTFKFMHCWLLLRNEQKWSEHYTSMCGGEPDTEPGKTNIDATLPARIERPVGRDKAKKARSNNSSSSACLEVLQQLSKDRSAYQERVEAATKEEAKDIASRSDRKLALQEEQLQVQKAQVQIQKELLELQKEDREERVMNMDVEKMAPWVREYYINKQKKIAAMSSRDDGSSGPSGH